MTATAAPQLPPAPEITEADRVAMWRAAKFTELGFDEMQVLTLVSTVDHHGFTAWWGKAQAMLDAGCPHSTAVSILT